MKKRLLTICFTAIFLFLPSCQTYYSKTLVFNQKFESGEYANARDYLESQKKLKSKNGKVLYNLNYATSSFWMDDVRNSIAHFDTADKYSEDFIKNYAYEALTMISNPTVRPYELEYFENVMIHFYQALNYIKMSNMEEALVECRRMNLVLERQSDAFRKHDGKRYSRDAFGHLLMGVVYEMTGDNNNAFVAYRNALEIYQDDYSPMYGTSIPRMLKLGLVRSAYRTGFAGEGRKYEKMFGISYDNTSSAKGRVVAFLFDGMSPIKEEASFDFVKTSGVGVASFTCSDAGLRIPIFIGDCSDSEKSSLNDFSYVRLTLPTYVDRKWRCEATMSVNGKKVYADEVENISKIARQSLKDRMWREVGKAILRAAAKETMHQVAAKQNEYVGLLVNIANAVTEKADTRCWMSLPARIRIVDVELEPGKYVFDYASCGTETAEVEVSAGLTSVLCFRGF